MKKLEEFRKENKELHRLYDELSKEAKALREREAIWQNVMDGSRDGFWEWHYGSNDIFFSDRCKKMLGFQEDEIPNDLHEWKTRMHPDDRETVFNSFDRHINGATVYYENEYRLQCKDGSYKWFLDRGKLVDRDQYGKPQKIVGTLRDMTIEREIEIENQRLLKELEKALDKVKLLSGLLPICAQCKKIRDDKGYWNQIENYIKEHSEAEFSHSICPECIKEMYPGFRGNAK